MLLEFHQRKRDYKHGLCVNLWSRDGFSQGDQYLPSFSQIVFLTHETWIWLYNPQMWLRVSWKMTFHWSNFFALFDLYEWSGEGRHQLTNCYPDFFVTTSEEPPSKSEGDDGEDLSSDEEQDLWDQFNDADTEDPGLDLECRMTDSSDNPVICHHSKRLQDISSSESEFSSEPVRYKK